MSTTTESVTSGATIKEGVEIKGKDVIKLTAPEILPPAGQLITVAQDIVGAINELGKKLDEKGSDAWAWPEAWIEMPDPQPNQVVMLMDTTNTNGYSAKVYFTDDDGNYGGVTIDCGDGEVITIPEGYGDNFYRKYAEKGQYVVTITTDYLMGINLSSAAGTTALRAIKVGSSLKLCGGYINTGHSMLIYAEFFGECLNYFAGLASLECVKAHIPPAELRDGCFSQCTILKYLGNFLSVVTTIPSQCFYGCTAITGISFPAATNIGGNSIVTYCNNLRKFSAPLLKEINSDDFGGCISLRTLEVADGCNLNGNTFGSCPMINIKYKEV